MSKRLMFSAALVALVAIGNGSAGAAEITSLAALSSNDSIDWGQLGPTGTVLTSPQLVTSTGGLGATVTSLGDLERRDEGSGWAGNFTIGDHLLWDQGIANPDSITITFDQAVRGFGAQIQADFFGPFTARITLSNGDVFTELGDSSNLADGSAIFIGALDPTADITSVTFDLTSAAFSPNDFAIDTLFLNTVTTVPEPLTLSLFGAGLAGTIALRRRRKVVS